MLQGRSKVKADSSTLGGGDPQLARSCFPHPPTPTPWGFCANTTGALNEECCWDVLAQSVGSPHPTPPHSTQSRLEGQFQASFGFSEEEVGALPSMLWSQNVSS